MIDLFFSLGSDDLFILQAINFKYRSVVNVLFAKKVNLI